VYKLFRINLNRTAQHSHTHLYPSLANYGGRRGAGKPANMASLCHQYPSRDYRL